MVVAQLGNSPESGNFVGHAVPGTVFLVVGVVLLLQSLRRARTLQPGQSFCETFVPEKDFNFLRTGAIVVIVLCSCGILLEGLGACIDPDPDLPGFGQGCFFYQFAHEVLYLIYGCAGVVALIEIRGLVPLDTWRAMLSISTLMGYLLWQGHAMMKTDMTDRSVHMLMANLTLAQAATIAFSVYNPRSFFAFIVSQGMFVMKAAWLFTAGVNAEFIVIDPHRVGPLFAFECVLVAMIIIVVGALYGQPSTSENAGVASQTEYSHLHIADAIDDDDLEDDKIN